MFIKNRFFNFFLMISLMFFSCSKMEKTKDNLVQKTKEKTSKISKKVWQRGVEKVFEYSTDVKPSKFEDVFGNHSDLGIKNQEGKQIEYIANFHQYFFRYTAEKDKILQFLNRLKTSHPEISDKKYSISNEQIIDEKLKFISIKFPNIYKKLVFFREFENKEGLEYYTIDRYPYSNIIIYDKKNDIIYHFVENYQE